MQSAFLIGETAEELTAKLAFRGIKAEVFDNLKGAVFRAYKFAKGYVDVLFSPGFASFDMFSNYIERGNSYESLVFDLKSACQVTTKLPVNNLHASY